VKEEEEEPQFCDLTLSQINELKNGIEQTVYAELSARYLGDEADALLRPLCLLFNLKYNSEDPTETVRQVFKKIKARVSHIINLDDVENPKLPRKVNVSEQNPQQFMQSPYLEVCKPVRDRLLVLLEVKPSVEYLNNVTKVGAGKCFSRYGSIKMTTRGGFVQGTPQKSLVDEEEAKDTSHKLDAEDDGSHADEIDDEPAEIGQADELLKPLPMFRSRSETVGATKFNMT
jgi:hypothetical protein